MQQIADAIYRLVISLWAGGVSLYTFLLTPIIFRNEPRDSAARIVGLLFPGYFRWGLGCGLAALLTLVLRGKSSPLQYALLLLMLAFVAFQAFYIEPKAADLKKRIGSFEKTSKDDPLRQEFSRLHGVSAVGNLGVVAGTVLLVIMK